MRPIRGPRDPVAESGYAMAGLLVAIGILSILMSVAMPAWRTLAKREKEAELLFRGRQYMRAIDLYQRRFPGAYPADLDVLVDQRFLRRAYLDPMTGEPFRTLTPGSAAAAAEADSEAGEEDGRRRNRRSGRVARNPLGAAGSGLGGRAGGVAPGPFPGTRGRDDDELGGIVGVVSRSPDESLREYNGATRYDQWLFVHQGQAIAPRAGSGPAGRSGVSGAAGGFGSLSQRPPGGGFGERAARGRPRGR